VNGHADSSLQRFASQHESGSNAISFSSASRIVPRRFDQALGQGELLQHQMLVSTHRM
jgi:hypothetical protein